MISTISKAHYDATLQGSHPVLHQYKNNTIILFATRYKNDNTQGRRNGGA